MVYDSPEEIRDYSVKGKWRIPINMHIGNMGLAQATGVPIITSPPSRTGGNIDNKRIGIGGKHSCDRLLLLAQNTRQGTGKTSRVVHMYILCVGTDRTELIFD